MDREQYGLTIRSNLPWFKSHGLGPQKSQEIFIDDQKRSTLKSSENPAGTTVSESRSSMDVSHRVSSFQSGRRVCHDAGRSSISRHSRWHAAEAPAKGSERDGRPTPWVKTGWFRRWFLRLNISEVVIFGSSSICGLWLCRGRKGARLPSGAWISGVRVCAVFSVGE